MRVRLSIARHELPAVKILWNVGIEVTTVSKLLEHVNDAVPLESDGWGFDDYAVEVNGYEALHYLNPSTLFHEDDEVSIRALQTPDIRARSISGRYQITAGGAHLIDGVAFGKTNLRQLSRPPVHIPPRKRPRLTYDCNAEVAEANTPDERPSKHPRIKASFDEANEEPDEGYEVEEDIDQSFTSDELPSTGQLRSGKRRKSVSFYESSLSAAHDEEHEDDDEDDDEDYGPDLGDVPSVVDSMDGDEDGFEEGTPLDLVDEDEDEPAKASSCHQTPRTKASSQKSSKRPPRTQTKMASARRIPSPSSLSDSDTSGTSSSSESDSSISSSSSGSSDSSDSDSSDSSDSDSEPESLDGTKTRDVPQPKHKIIDHLKQKPRQVQSPPGQGRKSTQTRNKRRSRMKRLNHLKRTGQVDGDITLAQLETLSSAEQDFEKRRQKLLDAIADGGVDLADNEDRRVQSSNLDHDAKTANVGTGMGAEGTAGATTQEEIPTGKQPNSVAKTVQPFVQPSPNIGTKSPARDFTNPEPASLPELSTSIGATVTPADSENLAKVKASEKKSRSRLDLASSSRLIFGSLGVRNPKTKAEEEKLRARLAEGPGSKKRAKGKAAPLADNSTEIEQTQSAAPKRPDAWKAKIKLSAVECCDEAVVLSTPPFPFKQRWDPQQQRASGKKRKRSDQYFNTDEFTGFEEGTGAGLNYDDEVEGNYGAAGDNGVHDSQQADLRALPDNVSELRELEEGDLHPGSIIAFKQLEMSQATGWAPTMSSYKTARLEHYDTHTAILRLQLAQRDRPNQQIEYDDEGSRIYGKYEMAYDETDEEAAMAASGQIELELTDLVEPKLIQAAPTDSDMSDSKQDSQTVRVPETLIDEFAQDSMFTNEGIASNVAEAGSCHISQSSDPSSDLVSSTPTPQAAHADEEAPEQTTSKRQHSPSVHVEVEVMTQNPTSTAVTLDYDQLQAHDSRDGRAGLLEATA